MLLSVVNCSQIFCTFAVETTVIAEYSPELGCELLSNFLYFCSRNNYYLYLSLSVSVVNCSQIFCTFAVETTIDTKYLKSDSCELLSNFLYFCSRNNGMSLLPLRVDVVNCSQIFCTFAVETTWGKSIVISTGCELLSNFLYFCSRNNG